MVDSNTLLPLNADGGEDRGAPSYERKIGMVEVT